MSSDAIHFRKAFPEDLPQLNRISFRSKKFWGYPEEWLAEWKDELTVTKEHLQQHDLLLAEKEKEILGFISVAHNEDHHEILHLWVVPEHIGKGHGRALLNRALRDYCNRSHVVLVTADPNAESFYRKQGFRTVSQVESYPPGRLLPVMKKKLT